MARKSKKTNVVQVRPVEAEAHPLPQGQGAAGAQIYRDPQTGQLMQVVPLQPGQTPMQPGQGGVVMPPMPADGSMTAFQGQMGIRTNADGSEEFVADGHVRMVKRTGPPTAGGDGIPDVMSKKRLIIGGLLAGLVLMILVDIIGMPHFRTGPGRYASLDGVKAVDNHDAPLVILKRLDRSVFLYTLDGIGWMFSSLGGGNDGKATPQ